jgi:hypothetical protein
MCIINTTLLRKKYIGTSFATDQNSVSLGMLDIALKKQLAKLLCGEISFGPRGNFSLYLMAMVLI